MQFDPILFMLLFVMALPLYVALLAAWGITTVLVFIAIQVALTGLAWMVVTARSKRL